MCHCVISASAHTSAGPLSLKQNGVFTFVITSGGTHCTLRTLTTSPEQVIILFIDPGAAACTHRTAAEHARLFQAVKRIHLRPSDPYLSFLSGAMASSAVASVSNLRDAAGNHAETRTGAYFNCGDAASFHEWRFRTRLCIAGKTGDQHIEAMSKVCDGLRGDAFVAAEEVGFDNPCEIIDGIPCGIDMLIQHMRGMVFPLTEHEPKELFRKYCRLGRPMFRQKGEYETARLATTTLLDTPDSNGPSNTRQ